MRTFAALLIMSGAAWPLPGPPPQDSSRIRELLARLDDDSIDVRAGAATELLELGAPVLPDLRRAAAQAGVELRSRLNDLIRKIQDRARLVLLLPPPTFITLEAQEISVREAFRRICRQASTPIDYSNVPEGLTVGVSLRHVPFWKAVDQVCRASGRVMPHAESDHVTITPEPYVELPGKTTDYFSVTLEKVDLATSVQFGQQEKYEHFTSLFRVSWEKGARPYYVSARICQLIDEAGTELVSPQDESEPTVKAPLAGDVISQEFPLDSTRGPGEAATRIPRFKVEVVFEFPLKFSEGTLDVSRDKTPSFDGPEFSIRMSRFDRLDGTLTGNVTFIPHVPLDNGLTPESVVLRDRKGNEYRASVSEGSSNGTGGETPYQLQFSGAPERNDYSQIVVRIPTEIHRERVELDFKDLKLK